MQYWTDQVASTRVEVGGCPACRLIAKWLVSGQRGPKYSAGIGIPIGEHLAEPVVSASETGTTGVRESLVMMQFLNNAGSDAIDELKAGKTPSTWSYERYRPTVHRHPSYMRCDDEQYDRIFPDHPLSRVRRWLRRAEKFFRVEVEELPEPSEASPPEEKAIDHPRTGLLDKLRHKIEKPAVISLDIGPVKSQDVHVEIRRAEVPLMSFEQMRDELGVRVVTDMMVQCAFEQMSVGDQATSPRIPFSERRRIYTEQMEQDLRKFIAEFQAAQGKARTDKSSGAPQ